MKSNLKPFGDKVPIKRKELIPIQFTQAKIFENILEELRIEFDSKIRKAMTNCSLELIDEEIIFSMNSISSNIIVKI